jgi:ferrous iron transport protein B
MIRHQELTAALAGNPNVGKSTVFNALTGAAQHTGNWPGKTVELATGEFTAHGRRIEVIDLPGTYSLAAQSPEEVIARDYVIRGQPDVILNVVDATNLERNLNLTLQILELTNKVVVALNFMDEVERNGQDINAELLEAALGVPVVPLVATRREGVEAVVAAMMEVADNNQTEPPMSIDYGLTVEKHAASIEDNLRELGLRGRNRYLALKLLEDDPEIVAAFKAGRVPSAYADTEQIQENNTVSVESLPAVLARAARLRKTLHPDAKVEIVTRRFKLAHEIAHRAVRRVRREETSRTEQIDRIVTHKIWAWPLMLAILGGMVWLTVAGAGIGEKWLSVVLLWCVHEVALALAYTGAPWWVQDPLVEGVLFGTASVVAVMLPPMVILFTIFDILQDIGFIPRVAFNLDRIMRALGSQGKHVLVLTMSLGCTVTGVLSSRVIENEKDRLVAIITSPLLLCSGRLGAATGLAILLFPGYSAPVMLSLALLSIVMTLLATLVLSKTIFRGEPSGFVMELPPYRVPQWRTVIRRSLIDQVGHVLGRAILFAAPASGIIWVLGHIPLGADFEATAIGRMVQSLAPVGLPLGLTGEMLVALLFTLPAKEIVVPALAMTHGLQATLAETPQTALVSLMQGWSPLVSYAFLVFFMLYLPCLVTMWAIWRETRSIRWLAMSLGVPLVTATVLTLFVYQGGRLLGFS